MLKWGLGKGGSVEFSGSSELELELELVYYYLIQFSFYFGKSILEILEFPVGLVGLLCNVFE